MSGEIGVDFARFYFFPLCFSIVAKHKVGSSTLLTRSIFKPPKFRGLFYFQGIRRVNEPLHSKLRGIEGRCVSIAKCRVGRGAQRRNPPLRTMGFAEFILSRAEGLKPSYP